MSSATVPGAPTPPSWRNQHPWIRGKCPMGCGETLFVGAGGHITCSWVDCPRPDAADALLYRCAAEAPA